MKTLNFQVRIWLSAIVIAMAGLSCEEDDQKEVVIEQDFNTGKNGWEAVFAEYPPNQTDYELQSGIKTLPQPLDQTRSGYMLSGNNHSDALQMFLVKKLDGLDSKSTYQVEVEVELASKYPDGSVGIGGSPSNAVHVIAHVCGGGYELVDGDQGNVEVELNKETYGYTQVELGDVAIPANHTEYEIISRRSTGPQTVKPNNKGEIWLLIGTWSGFEGTTTLYYTNFRITFTEV